MSVQPSTLYNSYGTQELEQRGKIIAEYVWIDGSGNCRSKQRTLPAKITSLEQLPEWNFDGSSTKQAETGNSEVIMRPVAYYPDPFRGGDNILVLVDTYNVDRHNDTVVPTNTNFRAVAKHIYDKTEDQVAWFGIEQEYTLFNIEGTGTKWPLGWPKGGYPAAQGPYYCAVGAEYIFGRPIMDAHYKACLHAGINISGTNGEVMPGQWEY